MVKTQHVLFYITAVLFFKTAAAQSLYAPNHYLNHRIAGGAVISFFKEDPHVMKNAQALRGFSLNYTAVLPVGTRASVLAGINYLNQGLQFNGYYAAPGYTYVFDESFAYVHRLRYQIIQVPLAMKADLNIEKDHAYTPYFLMGFGFGYSFRSSVSITSDSTEKNVYKGKTIVTFENYSLDEKLNAFFQAGFGIQKNMRKKARGLFLEFLYRYEISRLHYSGYQQSNNVNFRNSNLSINVGMKF